MGSIIDDIRALVPALSQVFYNRPLVYLDNAATSQKPLSVIELVNEMNSATNANVHRAMYSLSDKTTLLYEGARESVRAFINAPRRENIIFTSGATAAINLVASSYSQKYLSKGDSVLITADSHHSNIVPWQLAAERAGAGIKVLPINDDGGWQMEMLDSLLDERVKIVAATHVSNVLGIVNDIREIIRKAHAMGIPVLIDGAQGILHERVDVQELDCDFYAFSAHKIYGETGSGILYGKEDILNSMPPYMGGGDMVGTVSFQGTTYAELPLKFEAGTPNFIAAASLAPALEFAKKLRSGEWGEAVNAEERKIKEIMTEGLGSIEGAVIYGLPEREAGMGESGYKIPLFSFNVEGCHASDIAQMLDKTGIAVRSGQMCAEPVMSRFSVTGMVRASFAPYNTASEAEYFIESLKRVIKMLR